MRFGRKAQDAGAGGLSQGRQLQCTVNLFPVCIHRLAEQRAHGGALRNLEAGDVRAG